MFFSNCGTTGKSFAYDPDNTGIKVSGNVEPSGNPFKKNKTGKLQMIDRCEPPSACQYPLQVIRQPIDQIKWNADQFIDSPFYSLFFIHRHFS